MLRKESAPKEHLKFKGLYKRIVIIHGGEKNFTGHKININKNKRVKWILVNK